MSERHVSPMLAEKVSSKPASGQKTSEIGGDGGGGASGGAGGLGGSAGGAGGVGGVGGAGGMDGGLTRVTSHWSWEYGRMEWGEERVSALT